MWTVLCRTTFRFPAGNQLTNFLHTKWVIKEMIQIVERFGFEKTIFEIKNWLEQ